MNSPLGLENRLSAVYSLKPDLNTPSQVRLQPAKAKQKWPRSRWRILARSIPTFSSSTALRNAWADNPVFQGLKASLAGRVHKVSRDLWSRSRGPRAAIQILATVVELLKAESR